MTDEHTLLSPSIRFCEPAHVHTPYIAELSNTISSLSYVLVGLWNVWDVWNVWSLQQRNDGCMVRWCMGWNVVGIGVGSALFHATQRFDTELMDELPMLSLMLLWLYYNVCNHPWVHGGVYCGWNRQAIRQAIRKAFVPLVALVAYTIRQYIVSRNYDWFLNTFAFLLVLNIGLDAHTRYCNQRGFRWMFNALALLSLSQVAWQIEQWMVQQEMTNIHCYWLHSFWHVCSAGAIHFWLQVSG